MTSAFSACAQYSSRPISRAPPPERRIPRRVANTAERGGRRPRTRRMYSATRSAYRRKQRSRSFGGEGERAAAAAEQLLAADGRARRVARIQRGDGELDALRRDRADVYAHARPPPCRRCPHPASRRPGRCRCPPAAMPAEETAAMLAVAAPISTIKAVRSSLSDIPCPSAARMGDFDEAHGAQPARLCDGGIGAEQRVGRAARHGEEREGAPRLAARDADLVQKSAEHRRRQRRVDDAARRDGGGERRRDRTRPRSAAAPPCRRRARRACPQRRPRRSARRGRWPLPSR